MRRCGRRSRCCRRRSGSYRSQSGQVRNRRARGAYLRTGRASAGGLHPGMGHEDRLPAPETTHSCFRTVRASADGRHPGTGSEDDLRRPKTPFPVLGQYGIRFSDTSSPCYCDRPTTPNIESLASMPAAFAPGAGANTCCQKLTPRTLEPLGIGTWNVTEPALPSPSNVASGETRRWHCGIP